jgi:hypothetical protein
VGRLAVVTREEVRLKQQRTAGFAVARRWLIQRLLSITSGGRTGLIDVFRPD